MTIKSNGSNSASCIDTQNQNGARKTWRQVLAESAPLLLTVADNAGTAQIIELAGHPAYQIGGFALVGTRSAYPEIDLAQYCENSVVVRDIIAASSIPILVDAGLKAGRLMPSADADRLEEYDDMLWLPEWTDTATEFEGTHNPLGMPARGSVAARSSVPRPVRAASVGAFIGIALDLLV